MMDNLPELYPFDLGDPRRNRRAAQILQAALDQPGASIPAAAGSNAATQATYDFYDNSHVHPHDLDRAHRDFTLRLLPGDDSPLLVPQDTTELDFTSPARARTLGPLAHPKHFGLLLHSALALTSTGLPLGLLHVHAWTRDPKQPGKRKDRRRKETAQKESQRWLDTEAARVAALPAGRTIVTIGDREADFYDLFAVPRRAGQHVLIRAKARRRLAGSEHLLGVAVGQRPVAGHITVKIPRQDGRPGRTATLAVRFGSFALAPPSTHPRRQELAPVPLRAVFVEEVNPPAKATAVRWLLLTTLPVATLAEAEQVVRWYALRWRIERFHYTLKSGCRVEQLQLETAAQLRRALSLYAWVATRLLHLTYRARQEPEAACAPAVSREEWEVLWRHFFPGQPLPPEPPRLRQAVRWIAQLGGFLGRKGDGEPGVKVLWRGLQKLRAMVVGFRLAHAPPPTEQTSNQR
jgi:Transposase DNA-binding/Transposase Tn5 dimerisation domain